MSLSTQRTAVFNLVDAVSNSGNGYDYLRFADSIEEVRQLFKVTISGVDQMRGFMIKFSGSESTWSAFGATRDRVLRFRVHGLLGFDDGNSSEKTASNLAEAMANALDAGLNKQIMPIPAQIEVYEERMYGGVLVHWWEILVHIRETVKD